MEARLQVAQNRVRDGAAGFDQMEPRRDGLNRGRPAGGFEARVDSTAHQKGRYTRARVLEPAAARSATSLLDQSLGVGLHGR